MKKAIVTITGPSLSGKTTLARALQSVGSFSELTSHTTRPKRVGEVHGVDYFFVTDEEFGCTSFIEKVEFNGYRYGLSKNQVDQKLGIGLMPVVVVEPEGAREIGVYCAANGLTHFKIFLNTPLELRMERWLERVEADGVAKRDANLSRLESMLTVESKWRDLTGIRWDLLIGTYGASGHSPYQAVFLIADYLDVPLEDSAKIGSSILYESSGLAVARR